MKTKTAYRPKDNIPAETPRVEIDDQPIQPSATTHVEFTNGADPVEATVSAIEPATDTDEATAALLRQLEHLRASEHAQREFATQVAAQRAAQIAAPAPTLPAEPQARIALWRQAGLSDEDASFLEARPQMIDYPMVTRAAYAATLQAGIERTSPAFTETMEAHFGALLNGAQAQAQPAAADPAGFFRPPEPSRSPAAPDRDRAALYSAPVSRQTPSGGTGERPPRQIRLTAEEQEYARVAGVSDVEYAKMKQRLILAKANGDYGERR